MQIFVANPTPQHREFQYRTIFGIRGTVPTRVMIMAGQQVQLPGDFEGETLQQVVRQLENSGGVPENDPKAIRSRYCLLYKVAPRAITSEQIKAALKQEETVRVELASAEMEKAGLSAFKIAEQAGGHITETSLSVVEVNDDAVVKNGLSAEVIVSKRHPGRKTTSPRKPR